MARKAQSFKVDEKNKAIILYTNVEQNPAEKSLIDFYLSSGYLPKFAEKKAGKSIAEMRKELKADAEALAKFEEAYNNKDNKKAFFDACKIYNAWAKANKKNKDK